MSIARKVRISQGSIVTQINKKVAMLPGITLQHHNSQTLTTNASPKSSPRERT